MGDYIQDNVSIFSTPSGEQLVFIKGADKNDSKYYMDNITEWKLLGAFRNEESFELYLCDVLLPEIDSYRHRIKPVKNKLDKISDIGMTMEHHLYLEYFSKKPTKFPINLSDINENNIVEFHLSFSEAFSKKNKDEVPHDFLTENSGINEVERLMSLYDFGEDFPDDKKSLLLSYRGFCEKYKDELGEDLASSEEFCREYSSFSSLLGSNSKAKTLIYGAQRRSAIYRSFYPAESLKHLILMGNASDSIIRSHDTMKSLFNSFPSIVSEVFSSPEVEGRVIEVTNYIKEYIADLNQKIQGSDSNTFPTREWYERELNRQNTSLELIPNTIMLLKNGFIDGVFARKDAIQAQREEIEKEKDNLIPELGRLWNDLCIDAWYSNTYKVVPRTVKRLLKIKEDIDLVELSLENDNNKNINFLSPERKFCQTFSFSYLAQSARNKKALDRAVLDLYDAFSDVSFRKTITGKDIALDDSGTMKEGETITLPMLDNALIETWCEVFPSFKNHIEKVEGHQEYTLDRVTSSEIKKAMSDFKKELSEKEGVRQKQQATPSLSV